MVSIASELAREIYTILVKDCGADINQMEIFLEIIRTEMPPIEWRVFGKLGKGGKLLITENGLFVSAYADDLTPETQYLISSVNSKFALLLSPKQPGIECYYVYKRLEDDYGNESFEVASEIFFYPAEAQSVLGDLQRQDKNPSTFYSRYGVESDYINKTSLHRYIAGLSDEELREIRQLHLRKVNT